ncbi:hypothetical protein BB558_006390 [Smittium angustum]|uniref:RING-type E3 ubiquitin transferase n=1 Tax=Smittium angustum TaxID=133377 RepID=A0A2U1IV35_SMIAN|nr:hypothetical protein BB558_007394 [Smittium angustum]PVZ97640.1 hypothetical protein BB558_006390 [Smittium angustum]
MDQILPEIESSTNISDSQTTQVDESINLQKEQLHSLKHQNNELPSTENNPLSDSSDSPFLGNSSDSELSEQPIIADSNSQTTTKTTIDNPISENEPISLQPQLSPDTSGLRNRFNKPIIDSNSINIGKINEKLIIEDETKGKEDESKDKEAEATSSSKNNTNVVEDQAESFDPNKSCGEFSCNICFESASSPVLTVCGHLYCWHCLAQWLERESTCPVCKAGCEKDTLIPIYGRGKEPKDPRKDSTLGKRPVGQRPPVPQRRQNQVFGWDPFGLTGGFHSAGGNGFYVGSGVIGMFPGFVGFTYVSS